MRAKRNTVPTYLEEVVLKYTGEDCLIWQYSKDSYGYAQMRYEGRQSKVHRLVCLAVNGLPPTTKHQAAHTCGKGSSGCVSPSHLVWKTAAENQNDRLLHGTHNRGERQGISKLTEDAVREIRNLRGQYSCTQLGRMYGVDFSLISKVHRGTVWGWLDDYAARAMR